MSVRKRTWKTAKGETKECWIVDYVDQHGERRGKNFAKKKDADASHATVWVEVRPHTRQSEHHRRGGRQSVGDDGRDQRSGAHHHGGIRAPPATAYRPAPRLHAAVAVVGAGCPPVRGQAEALRD